jgi:hypothetical protein
MQIGLAQHFLSQKQKMFIFAGATFVLTPNWRGQKRANIAVLTFRKKCLLFVLGSPNEISKSSQLLFSPETVCAMEEKLPFNNQNKFSL